MSQRLTEAEPPAAAAPASSSSSSSSSSFSSRRPSSQQQVHSVTGAVVGAANVEMSLVPSSALTQAASTGPIARPTASRTPSASSKTQRPSVIQRAQLNYRELTEDNDEEHKEHEITAAAATGSSVAVGVAAAAGLGTNSLETTALQPTGSQYPGSPSLVSPSSSSPSPDSAADVASPSQSLSPASGNGVAQRSSGILDSHLHGVASPLAAPPADGVDSAAGGGGAAPVASAAGGGGGGGGDAGDVSGLFTEASPLREWTHEWRIYSLLVLAKFFERLAFFGFISSPLFQSTERLLWGGVTESSLTSLFFTLLFFSYMLGAVGSDAFMGRYRTIAFPTVLVCIGYFISIFENKTTCVIGLVIVAVGVGITSINDGVLLMLDQLPTISMAESGRHKARMELWKARVDERRAANRQAHDAKCGRRPFEAPKMVKDSGANDPLVEFTAPSNQGRQDPEDPHVVQSKLLAPVPLLWHHEHRLRSQWVASMMFAISLAALVGQWPMRLLFRHSYSGAMSLCFACALIAHALFLINTWGLPRVWEETSERFIHSRPDPGAMLNALYSMVASYFASKNSSRTCFTIGANCAKCTGRNERSELVTPAAQRMQAQVSTLNKQNEFSFFYVYPARNHKTTTGSRPSYVSSSGLLSAWKTRFLYGDCDSLACEAGHKWRKLAPVFACLLAWAALYGFLRTLSKYRIDCLLNTTTLYDDPHSILIDVTSNYYQTHSLRALTTLVNNITTTTFVQTEGVCMIAFQPVAGRTDVVRFPLSLPTIVVWESAVLISFLACWFVVWPLCEFCLMRRRLAVYVDKQEEPDRKISWWQVWRLTARAWRRHLDGGCTQADTDIDSKAKETRESAQKELRDAVKQAAKAVLAASKSNAPSLKTAASESQSRVTVASDRLQGLSIAWCGAHLSMLDRMSFGFVCLALGYLIYLIDTFRYSSADLLLGQAGFHVHVPLFFCLGLSEASFYCAAIEFCLVHAPRRSRAAPLVLIVFSYYVGTGTNPVLATTDFASATSASKKRSGA